METLVPLGYLTIYRTYINYTCSFSELSKGGPSTWCQNW